MGEAVVQVKGLTKAFDGVVAVDGVSFEIAEGEIVGLVGPNGAGKTTTVQMLLGIVTPTSGTIRIFGRDLAAHREAILGRVNFSSSYASLPYALTVEENLRVFARLYGLRDDEAQIERVLRLFEIEPLRSQLTSTISSGQLSRLCLAKALLNDPRVLFLDEPTASMDPDIADKTRVLFRQIRHEQGVAILYTSHNMREMETLCDRLIFLHRGRILASGPPQDLVARFGEADLEAVFLRVSRGRV